MNLAAKYDRTELIRDGDIQAWKGVERSTGEAVLLYLYTGHVGGGQPLGEVARGALQQSLGSGEAAVEGGVFGLSPCVVAREARASAPAPVPPGAPEPPRFTAPPPSAPAASGPGSAALHSAPIAAPEAAPGEFTAMFGAAAGGLAPANAQAVSAPQQQAPAAAPPLIEGAGNKASAAAQPAEPPVSAEAPAPPPAGVFTNLFVAAEPPMALPAEPVAEPVKPAPPPNPGVFTSLYMAADPSVSVSADTAPENSTSAPPSAPEEPASAPEPEAGVFTSLFMAAAPGETAVPVTAEPPAAEPPGIVHDSIAGIESAPVAAEAEEPGEFTMAFGAAGFSESEIERAAPEDVTERLALAPETDNVTAASITPEPVVESVSNRIEAVEHPSLPPTEQADAATEDSPGEFTRLFDAMPAETGGSGISEAAESAPTTPAATAEEAVPTVGEAAGPLAEFAAGNEEAERYSSASPAKGPIRFASGDKSPADDAPKQPRSPLSSGSFSQTYVSTGEMPAMMEPISGIPAAAPYEAGGVAEGSEAPGEFTMLFTTPGTAGGAGATATPPFAATPSAATQQPAEQLGLPEPAPKAPATPAVSATPPAAASTPAQGDAPGEFTRFFQQGDVDKIKEEVAAMSASALPAPNEAKPAEEPPAGEFTRMFSAAEALSKVEKPKDQGVFTSLYIAANPDQAQESSPAAPAPPPAFAAPARDSGGSFTNLFRAADVGISPNEPPSAPTADFPPPPSAGGFSLPQSSSIGEEPSFTRYFQAGDLPAVPSAPQEPDVVVPSPDLPAYSSGYSKGATSFFQAVPEPAVPEAQADAGPGEYTQMISGAELQQAMGGTSGPPHDAPAAGPSGGGGGGVSVNIPLSTPHVSGPYVQGPRMSGPYISGPQISSSGISAPHVQGPHFSGPQMSGPYVQGPHLSTPNVQVSSVQTPPIQTGGGSPASAGPPAVSGGGVSKIIIIATVLVTVIAVVLVLLVAYFMLKP